MRALVIAAAVMVLAGCAAGTRSPATPVIRASVGSLPGAVVERVPRHVSALSTADGARAFVAHHRRHLRLRFRAEPVELPPAGRSQVVDAAGGDAPHSMVVVGDSLAVGMAPALRTALDGWRLWMDARVGRPLAEGMGILDSTQLPGPSVVLAMSLFTNDGPRNLPALEAAVRRSVVRAGPD